jgi:uncharacterized protein (TIGR00299 family) protein
MATAYFDCFAGAAGDMLVGALIDAGASLDTIRQALASLALEGYELQASSVQRNGIAATKFDVVVTPDAPQPHRHLSNILTLIDHADLPARVAKQATGVFRHLAEAEAAVHGCGIDDVHFHEVGAVDSIVDIVAACVALNELGASRIVCSPIAVGSGTVTCDHGVLPVPTPATARMLRGVPVLAGPNPGEATTPTAAALLTALADEFGIMPAMDLSAMGAGAGTRDDTPAANIVRVFLGLASDNATADTVIELAANLDDCTGELLGATIDLLLARGALDAWVMPATMKKSRPAWVLSVLARPADVALLEDIIFNETPTLGIRRHSTQRTMLARRQETVETPYGPIRVKIAERNGAATAVKPEFDDCQAAATNHNVSIRQVQLATRAAYAHQHNR